MSGKFAIVSLGCAAAAWIAWLQWPRPAHRVEGPMPHEVYVWQRAWTEPVVTAVTQETTQFSRIVALAAEVHWEKGEAKVVRVSLDHDALRQSRRPIGLAMRIGTFPGPFASDDARARWLAGLAASLVGEAESRQLEIGELQIDFDCAESKLAGYALWLGAIRRAVSPHPVVITALPSWLKRPDLRPLVRAADGFVLQVHSLERPHRIEDDLQLCDPLRARKAVERAARLGRPFRVALPTYGYVTAFDPGGNFVGLSAEGPARQWPEGTRTREVRADPSALSGLIRQWTDDRPERMQGVIWYRLPVRGDRLNWTPPTLAAVMAGHTPKADLRIRLRRTDPRLVELDLCNLGTADHNAPVRIAVRWEGARRVAGDAFKGFDFRERSNTSLECWSDSGMDRLPPGAARTVCWLRFDREPEVNAQLQ